MPGTIARHPRGIAAADVAAEFPERDVRTCLAGLLRSNGVTRIRRGVYAFTDPTTAETPATGVKPGTVRSTLTTLGILAQSYVNQGALTRNVIALVERRPDAMTHEQPETAKSWTLAEVEQFRASVRNERLLVCWLLSCYGLCRSEALGTRWSALECDTLCIRRSRVSVGKEAVERLPKSRSSRRDLRLPAELATALTQLKDLQQEQACAFGSRWSDDRLIAVREDSTPVRHEWSSEEFQRLRTRTRLRRIHLKSLRNTSVSLMPAGGLPIHVAAARLGHDPTVSLSIYSDARRRRPAGRRRRALRISHEPLISFGAPQAHWPETERSHRTKKPAPTLVRAGFSWSG